MAKKKRSKSKKNAVAGVVDKTSGGEVVEKPVKAPEIDWGAFKLEILADVPNAEIPMKKDKKVKTK